MISLKIRFFIKSGNEGERYWAVNYSTHCGFTAFDCHNGLLWQSMVNPLQGLTSPDQSHVSRFNHDVAGRRQSTRKYHINQWVNLQTKYRGNTSVELNLVNHSEQIKELLRSDTCAGGQNKVHKLNLREWSDESSHKIGGAFTSA